MTRIAYSDLLGKKSRQADEEQLHRSIVAHLRVLADDRVIWFHVPNGGARSKASAGKLKAMGTLPGAPDLVFILPDATVCFLELKIQGGRLSPAQEDFATRCEAINVEYAVAYTVDNALQILVDWAVLPPTVL